MYKFGGSGGGSRREILALHEAYPEPAGGGIERDAASGGATANDEHVQGLSGCGPRQRHSLRVSRGRGRPRPRDALPGRVEGGGGGVGGGRG